MHLIFTHSREDRKFLFSMNDASSHEFLRNSIGKAVQETHDCISMSAEWIGGEALGVRRLDAAFTLEKRRQAAALQGALRAREMNGQLPFCWESHRRAFSPFYMQFIIPSASHWAGIERAFGARLEHYGARYSIVTLTSICTHKLLLKLAGTLIQYIFCISYSQRGCF